MELNFTFQTELTSVCIAFLYFDANSLPCKQSRFLDSSNAEIEMLLSNLQTKLHI